jgi:hypothetical protein
VLIAQMLEPVEKEAGEQPHSYPNLQDEEVLLQRPRLLGLHEAGENHLGGLDGEVAVVVDQEGDQLGIADEGQAAALLEVTLPQLPVEALGQWLVVLEHNPDRLGLVQNLQGRQRTATTIQGRFPCSRRGGM